MVKEKGLETFRKSSIKRKDNKRRLLVGLKSVAVHDVCRKRYNDENTISAFLRRGGDVASVHPQLRSTTTFTVCCSSELVDRFCCSRSISWRSLYSLCPQWLDLFACFLLIRRGSSSSSWIYG